MRTIDQNVAESSLGEAIVASYEVGSAVSPDHTVAAELVASHVGRMLAQRGNARLAAGLALLASEFDARL
jgi:hypothetical protein